MLKSGFDKLPQDESFAIIAEEDTLIGQGTLDEPVRETIMRDLRRIGFRIRHVLIPTNDDRNESELRNWDLWGPLLLCLLLACTMSFGSSDEDSALVFTAVFMIVWCGAIVVTLNAALLGGKMYVFYIVACVLTCINICLDHSFNQFHCWDIVYFH